MAFFCDLWQPNTSLHKRLWARLHQKPNLRTDSWLLAGDFNVVANADELSNPRRWDQRKCSGFNDWIFEHGLVDLDFIGPKFTWTRGSSPSSFKGARLDPVAILTGEMSTHRQR